jgi:hypothetical protein
MPTYKGRKSSKGDASIKKSGATGKRKGGKGGSSKNGFAPSTDPIIITGGSLLLEYADGTTDGFQDNGSGGGRKRLKHKRNTGGRAELRRIEIYSPAPPSNSPPPPLPTPTFVIDLLALGIHGRCQIRVQYDVE